MNVSNRRGWERLPDEGTPAAFAQSHGTFHDSDHSYPPRPPPVVAANHALRSTRAASITAEGALPTFESTESTRLVPGPRKPLPLRLGKVAACLVLIIIVTTIATVISATCACYLIIGSLQLASQIPKSEDTNYAFKAALVGSLVFSAVLGVVLCAKWTLKGWATSRGTAPYRLDESIFVFVAAFELSGNWSGSFWLLPIVALFSTPVGMVLLRDPAAVAATIPIHKAVVVAEIWAIIPELLFILSMCRNLWFEAHNIDVR